MARSVHVPLIERIKRSRMRNLGSASIFAAFLPFLLFSHPVAEAQDAVRDVQSAIDGNVSDPTGIVAHYVQIDRIGRTIRYRTGSNRFSDEDLAELSHDLLASDSHDNISINIRGSVPINADWAHQIASDVRAGIHTAIHSYGFNQDVAVVLDLYLVPPGTSVSREWRMRRTEDEPWHLQFVESETDDYSQAARARRVRAISHEVYHLFVQTAGRGSEDPRARSRPASARFFEEISAFLVGQCASLDAVGLATASGLPNAVVTSVSNPETPYRAPYTDQFLDRFLAILATGVTLDGRPVPIFVHLGFNLTAWSELTGGEVNLSDDAYEAQAVRAICDYVAPDPFGVELWFQGLAEDGRDAPPFEQPVASN